MYDYKISVLLVKHEDALQLRDIFYGFRVTLKP